MLSITDLFVMLLLCGLVASWMGLTAARERAVAQASRLCGEHDVQLLDQSVALSALRLYRHDGHLGVEVRYGFEVSLDGRTRQRGQIWMRGRRVSKLVIPERETPARAPSAEPGYPDEPDYPEAVYGPRRPPASPKRIAEGTTDNVIPFRPKPKDPS
jgi:uncharacterized protein DUF3301